MALFKIEKGLAENLTKNRPYSREGNCYFTTDDGKFYIDTAGDGTTATPAIVGQNRILLNAYASDVLKAKEMSTTDGIMYPILTFEITDAEKNLIEAKRSKIGFKNGTLIIPNLEDQDEMYITNEGDGRALVIEKLRGPTGNNGPGPGIEIKSTEASTYAIEVTGKSKGIKVTQDPTDDLELTTKQYVDTSVASKQDKIFWATYGTTTLDEMKTAYDAGKDVKCLKGSVIYTLYGCIDSGAYFFYSRSDSLYVVTCSSGNLWKSYSRTIPTKTSQLTNDSHFVISTNLANVATSGSYNDLSDKPTIPDNFKNYAATAFGVTERYWYYDVTPFNTLANSLTLI